MKTATLILATRTEFFNTNKDKIKIVHLSDLHRRSFGKHNKRLIKKISSLKPDIIIFSGDLITRDLKSLDVTEKFIQKLVNIAPVYFSFGNHELDMKRLYPDKYQKFIYILKNNGVHILNNKSESILINNRKINITGASLKYSVYKKNDSYKNLDGYSSINPDYTLCGHVHGGIIRLFGIPFLSPERKFFPQYSKGVFEINGMKLLVSGGLGKLRLFNPPEIPVYYI